MPTQAYRKLAVHDRNPAGLGPPGGLALSCIMST
jgi:hypothetical protein